MASIALGLCGASIPSRAAEEKPGTLLNQHHVIPILMQHCWACHGASTLEAALDLRSRASMLKGGQSGAALVPGDPEASPLIHRIRSGECPPNKRLVEANVKPVPDISLAKLVDWIAGGAPEAEVERDLAGTREDPLVKDKNREFWSFRLPKQAPPLQPREPRRVRNPVDAFLLRDLEARGLSFAPEASKTVLLRRVYFDLIGLPPTPSEVAAFTADSASDAYEKLIDRLLASPRYGERWGRYWLDAAGYADVEGRREQHLPRPFAYRYRDYVIQAFNADKPYDRFLLEQIAGDELADYESAPRITSEICDNLIATGFLRLGPDPTWANITGFVPDRIDVIADAMDVLGSSVLGLTLKCARCHNHKFDPIPQRDYFRLLDLFKGALDEYDWLKPDLRSYGGAGNTGPLKERSLPYVTSTERESWKAEDDLIQRQIAELSGSIVSEEERVRARYREAELAKMSEEVRELARQTLAAAPAQRSSAQVDFAKAHMKELSPDRNALARFDPEFKVLCDRLAATEARRKPEPRVAAMWDRGNPSPTYIYRRGDYQRPGALVKGGIPAVLADPDERFLTSPPWPGSNKTGRRLAFARWLTRPEHPLTSRVLVNRIWTHHFGRGLVRSVDNFGKTGTPPTHPELLDWLAGEFVRRDWRLKTLHRLLLTSSAYRQSSTTSPDQARLDPDNALLSRMPMSRLDAEAIWDTVACVAGALDVSAFGPPVPVQVRKDGSIAPGRTGDRWRRSIYGQQTRKEIPTLLEAFDLPAMNPNCIQRSESIVATQALHLMNDAVMRDLAQRFAARLQREGGPTLEGQIQLAFQIAFARTPSTVEIQESVDLVRAASGIEEGPGSETGNAPKSTEAGRPGDDERALATLCLALLNSAEFLYVD